jgi:hypothetical protein
VCPAAKIVSFNLMRNKQASALSILACATAVVPIFYLKDLKYPRSGLRHFVLRCYEKEIPEVIPLLHYSANLAELHIAIKFQLLLGELDDPGLYADTLELWSDHNLFDSPVKYCSKCGDVTHLLRDYRKEELNPGIFCGFSGLEGHSNSENKDREKPRRVFKFLSIQHMASKE